MGRPLDTGDVFRHPPDVSFRSIMVVSFMALFALFFSDPIRQHDEKYAVYGPSPP